MNIVVIGTGYVGLPTAACLAECGNRVTCVDKDSEKIRLLSDGHVTIFEPDLESLVLSTCAAGTLRFTSSLLEVVGSAEIIFVAVGTPSLSNGEADLSQIYSVATELGEVITNDVVVVLKSTVPVGTTEIFRERLLSALQKRRQSYNVGVVFCPEFLKQGSAVEDTRKPDRIIIGSDSVYAQNLLREVLAPFQRNHDRTLVMSARSAEMTKYAANCMLATKISFMNEVSEICEKLGADVEDVRNGIGADPRIGYQFIYPGVGFGGSCFPKDLAALSHTCERVGVSADIINAVIKRNKLQKINFVHRIEERFSGNLEKRKIAIWGLAFKPNTDDLREAPSLHIVSELLRRGAQVSAFDPVANENFAKHFMKDGRIPEVLALCDDPYECLDAADCLLILTEWKLFRAPDFALISCKLKSPIIFDGRNIYDPRKVTHLGFEYWGIGRSAKG